MGRVLPLRITVDFERKNVRQNWGLLVTAFSQVISLRLR